MPPAFPNQEQPPPPLPDLIDGFKHYEVEKVLDSQHHKVRGKAGQSWHSVTNHFVKWKGYGPESNSWVQEDNMDTDELVKEFLAKHIDMVINRTPDWHFYIDPFMKKRVWYDQEEDWDWLGGHNDPSTDTKSLFELMGIP